ncbi:M48 family metallopeptidase [Stigmatella erecta]|uniref:Peptidase family M48 n=1 Tax=Stigmatella erecta TaxID=83460 RepID=A0A1I0IL57_9BACT|nr:M48 family metallopeptidase [Stigmatella erecta]SET97685.1 Peptidase family M48 [Stigmatella erecta]
MNRHLLRLAVLGLGLTAASCAATKESLQRLASVEVAQSVKENVREFSQCDRLKADISFQEEYDLGGAVALSWVRKGGGLMLANTPEKQLHQYLNTVGRNLAAQSSRPTLRWTFGALQDPETFNATSAPGGYVFLTRRLLQNVDNEAQLAGVLAHEIAHITLKHALNSFGGFKVKQCQVGAWTPDTPLFGEALGKGADSIISHVSKGFDKDDEFAADALAIHLLVSAGYEPTEYTGFIGKIPESTGITSTHPKKSERLKRMVAVLETAKKPSDGFSEWPAGMQGLVVPPLPPAFSVVQANGR